MDRPASASPANPRLPGVSSLRLTPDLYLLHTQPGFEGIAIDEASARVPDARPIGQRLMPGRSGIGVLRAPCSPALIRLRCAEDLFGLVAYRNGLGAGREALDRVRTAIRDSRYFEWALQARVRLMPGSRAGRRLRFRVIARLALEREFRRADLKRAAEQAIAERGDHHWQLDETRADVEFWVTLVGAELLVALRLSDERMRHRSYKIADRAASLRPSVAAALAWLSAPRADDVVLDPFCGTGTILIERAEMERYRMLYGGDSEPDALAAARTNVGPRYKPIELRLWDAAALPLEDRAVTKIVTNLPWGIKYGTHGDNRRLYPRLLAEFSRVLAPGGKIVMLTGERALMRELIGKGGFYPDRMFRVSILGAGAVVYVGRAS